MKTKEESKIVTAIEQAEIEIEKDQPVPEDMFAYYQHSLLEVGYAIVPLNILHEFFNHKSDANKYLEATEQEDLEVEFHDYIIGL